MITLGPGSYIVQGVLDVGSSNDHLLIGKYLSLAHNINFIIGLNHPYHVVSTYPFAATGIWGDTANVIAEKASQCNRHQIIIGHDVWIGENVTIMGGVRIGNGAVIGANAVVAKDIPPYAIAVGNPAKIIKYRFDSDTISQLQVIKWWDWSEEKIKEALPFMVNMEKFLRMYYCPPSVDNVGGELQKQLAELHNKYKIYHLRPDWHSGEALWRIFLEKFVKENSFEANRILLVWLKDTTEAKMCMKEISELLVKVGQNAPKIMSYNGDDNVMHSIINYAEVIVTTKEMVSLDIIESKNSEVDWIFADD
ncbi:CatB-related O-acetyltransferase [Selenomonas sp. AE3005]|uniref:CatB-related O-acetyltransferase n=1 Tax=Selenomonas sp. AE3005 TaxID=1485543 RepID=UPI00069147AD|nr:CatB-related O-acetyltransferase [Selenomonas sp. AE3005]